MVVTTVNPKSTATLEAISTWKKAWKATKFDQLLAHGPVADAAIAMLSEFGESYVKMSKSSWQIQRRTLVTAEFTKEENYSTR
jgi:hypothetical protein